MYDYLPNCHFYEGTIEVEETNFHDLGDEVITISEWENDPFEAATRLAKSNGVPW